MEPNLTKARQIVYDAIKELNMPVTDVEISLYLNIPINRVSGRVGDLENLGLIICNDNERNEAGNRCRKSYIKPESSHLRPEVKQILLRQERVMKML